MPGSIDYDAEAGRPFKINYTVPLPSKQAGRRIVRLDLGLAPADFLEAASAEGVSYAQAAGVSRNAGAVSVDLARANNFLHKRLTRIGFSAENTSRALSALPALLATETPASLSFRPGGNDPDRPREPVEDVIGGIIVDPVLGDPIDLVREFATHAIEGRVVVPTETPSGRPVVDEAPADEAADPQLFLIEVYGFSAFPGDYGMGRTIRTFSLLPGESTTIKLKTWQSTKESIKQASSIVDSHEQSAKDRFSKKMQTETTDKSTKTSNFKWNVAAEAEGSWGFGSAKVSAGAEGEYHSAREQFGRKAGEAINEHANEASSKRELSVNSSSEVSTESGSENVIERVINNVNMRRVLNFVFRELNQAYTTKLHLKDIHVAYSNGREGSWRQVPISGLRGLLTEVLDPTRIEAASAAILKIASVVFDANDSPVRVLDKVEFDPITDAVTFTPATPNAQGALETPTETRFYRFKKGPIGQADHANPVDGVLLSEQQIVMRTESAIVEALLGESDALDQYAMEIQEAAARGDTLRNRREEMLHEILAAVADPMDRAVAAAMLFGPEAGEGDDSDEDA